MNFCEEQKREIETIKERIVKLELSDADCERISRKAGISGLTVSELLENFIGDLVNGTYSNGSDERDKAYEWYNRCWFANMNNNLLHHLIECNYNVPDFLEAYDELQEFEINPQSFEDEIELLEDDEQLWFKEDYEKCTGEFLEKNKNIDLNKEIEICRKWLNEARELKK